MHCIPTRLDGVHLIRYGEVASGEPPGDAGGRPGPCPELPFTQLQHAERAATSELSYSKGQRLYRGFRCLQGELFVVAADIRLGSPTFGHWQSFVMRDDQRRQLTFPAGVACGWQVLSADAQFELQASQPISDEDWHWLRWDDFDLGITWPEHPEAIQHHPRPGRSLDELSRNLLPKYLSDAASTPNIASTEPHSRMTSAEPESQQAFATRARGDSKLSHVCSDPVDETLAPIRVESRSNSRNAAELHQAKPIVLVIGSQGQLGRELCRHLRTLATVVGGCRQPQRDAGQSVPIEVDVARPASLRQAIRTVKPTLIVNASGLTDIELAEKQPRLAQMVNANAPALMAEEARRIGAALVHFCSDMVFSGEGQQPWREADPPQPINQYGRTKLLGTQAVQQSGVPHLILRPSWLYSPHGENYVTRMVDLLTYRNTITLANDHYGTPTSTHWLAELITQLLSRAGNDWLDWLDANGGLFHAAPLGYTNRIEAGDQIMATSRKHGLPIVTHRLQPESLRNASKAVQLPMNTRLNCSKLGLHFQISLLRWQQDLEERLAVLLATDSMVDRVVA